MSRFFIPQESIQGNTAIVTGKEAHHILNVMRLERGDRVQFFDGSGRLYQGKIFATQSKKLKLKIESVRKDFPLSSSEITLLQALPKKNKMDYIVEKATELGIDVIVPMQTARTIVRLDQRRQSVRRDRWQRLTREAAKQCGRRIVPQIMNLISWPKVLDLLNSFDLKLIACLSEKSADLKDVLPSLFCAKYKRIAFLIGPEGDFTAQEVREAEGIGCIAVSLGKSVLKSDTATIAALAILNYELRR